MLQDNSTAAFRRQDFVACRWEPRMANMQAYVVTDTATSDQASACLTVAAVVAIDWDRTCYVIDMVCGRWMPSVALDEIARLFIKWKSHMRGAQTLRHLHSIAMEKVTMNSVYRHGIEEVLQKRGHHADIIELPRGASSVDKKTGQNDTKALRIRSLEPVVRAHKLRMVVDTMTPLWDDRGTERPIYAERGFTDQHGAQLPGGELVDEFVRWRDQAGYKGLVDIPDALSALTQTDARGDFLLQASPRPNVVEQRGLRAGDSLDRVLSIQPQAHPRRTSFFDRLLNQ